MNQRVLLRRALVALGVAAALSVAGLALWPRHDDATEHQQHATAEHGALTLDEGRRWATDAPLRAGMGRIRDAVAAAGPAPSQEAAAALAQTVREQVSYLVANCKLKPRADAALHVLIADLLAGAESMVAAPSSGEGLERIGSVLRRYPEYFEHPGWQGLAGP